MNDRRQALEEQPWYERPVRVPPPARKPPEEDKPEEDTDPSKTFGGLWSRADRPHKIEFRFLDPQRDDESFDYAWLPRIKWGKGRGEIKLLFEAIGVTVTIRGVNLWDLKEKLRRHLVTWVQELGDDPVMIQEEKLRAQEEGRKPIIIYEIRIEEPKDRGGEAGQGEHERELEDA
ncbi:MAG: hypothetical protein L0170_16350 [Acidobacteria bacterium]|nr:hypothetical protein [Acidobacteriota bacterium]